MVETPGTWDHLVRQTGMFGFLGLSPSTVVKLRGKLEPKLAPTQEVVGELTCHRTIPRVYGRQL